jgi:DNA polymerase
MPATAAVPPRPRFRSLKGLNRALVAEQLFLKDAGRVVLGKGPIGAPIALVGEQPGDQEDREGVPFVGPAGRLLDEALEEAGIDRAACYLTNAVKQFSFIQRGKKRLHQRPTTATIVHYRWWLDLELAFVAPRIIVALGATALFALSNKRLPLNANRGPYPLLGLNGYVTLHPSAILRVPDQMARRTARRSFVADLQRIRRLSETKSAPVR